jgi:GT2 family glycosyltransferase
LEDHLPLVSIVIVTWNGERYIEKLLSTLAHAVQVYPNTEVIVVDNGSTDGTLQKLEEFRSAFDGKLKVVKLARNLGFGGGNNVGIALSRGKLVFLLNQDTYVKRDTLKNAVAFFQKNSRVGVAQCLLLQYRLPVLMDSCGDRITKAGLGIIGCWGEKYTPSSHELENGVEIEMARGAALIVRREILEISKRVYGTYIPAYFVTGGCEDWFISFLARALGYRIALITSCHVYHDSLAQRQRDPYILYNALSFFIDFGAPALLFFNMIFFSVASVLAFRSNPLRLLYAVKSLLKSVRRRIATRYRLCVIMQRLGCGRNLWNVRISATEWLRWYVRMLRRRRQLSKLAAVTA